MLYKDKLSKHINLIANYLTKEDIIVLQEFISESPTDSQQLNKLLRAYNQRLIRVQLIQEDNTVRLYFRV